MIKVSKLSYSFPQKDLYNKVSFTLEENRHCAFIGTNGTGKSTLINIIMNPDDYLYDGKVEKSENCTIGYVSQFSDVSDDSDITVYEYISEEFVRLQREAEDICEQMATGENLEELMERYQNNLDEFNSIDGDHYESNIKKQLKVAGLEKHENLPVKSLSGGEFKLVQVIKEMILSPKLIIMDEPDVFLDFEHLDALRQLINSHRGTMLVITHNRYLLSHCFNKIIHLENTEIQEFDGTYMEYNFLMLQTKIEMQELAAADLAEIERNRKIVEKLRNEATAVYEASRGRTLHARVSFLERLEARKTKSPFVDIKQPKINFKTGNDIEGTVLKVRDYSVSFDESLLENIEFDINAGDKVAIVGANGTGKTTLLREIYRRQNDAIEIAEGVEVDFLSQIQGEVLDESHTLIEEFENMSFKNNDEIEKYLADFGFDEETVYARVSALSGGEKNLLQLAKISAKSAELLLLDEPTSHLDTYAQIALEEAISAYSGTVIMVSHDFYTVANCVDYVLYVEDRSIRRMSVRKFRKMIYANHFDKDYLELEQKKKEVETKIAVALKANNPELARKLSEELEGIINKL